MLKLLTVLVSRQMFSYSSHWNLFHRWRGRQMPTLLTVLVSRQICFLLELFHHWRGGGGWGGARQTPTLQTVLVSRQMCSHWNHCYHGKGVGKSPHDSQYSSVDRRVLLGISFACWSSGPAPTLLTVWCRQQTCSYWWPAVWWKIDR